MPAWDCSKELCNLCFGPAIRGTRLSELARLPFLSTVQEYSDHFNAVLCHAPNLSALQKAELFVGGLPEHIKVDVELRQPHDLQTAMHLARAFERRAMAVIAMTLAAAPRPVQPTQRALLAQPRRSLDDGGRPTQVPGCPFRRLMPAEQLERRRLGLCYNSDEPYIQGHQW